MHSLKQHNTSKLDILLKQDKKIFHVNDLKLLWQINNKNTLYSTLHRYSKKGYLTQIYKGLYSTQPIEKLDPLKLGASAIHNYSYLSTETVLVRAGIIFQDISHYTFISNKTKKFSVGPYNYISRQLKDQFLFNDVGINKIDSVNQASLERAVADMVYFNSSYHFDADNLIDWDKVDFLKRQIGYKL